MCVCVCVYIYIYTHTHICTYIYDTGFGVFVPPHQSGMALHLVSKPGPGPFGVIGPASRAHFSDWAQASGTFGTLGRVPDPFAPLGLFPGPIWLIRLGSQAFGPLCPVPSPFGPLGPGSVPFGLRPWAYLNAFFILVNIQVQETKQISFSKPSHLGIPNFKW